MPTCSELRIPPQPAFAYNPSFQPAHSPCRRCVVRGSTNMGMRSVLFDRAKSVCYGVFGEQWILFFLGVNNSVPCFVRDGWAALHAAGTNGLGRADRPGAAAFLLVVFLGHHFSKIADFRAD